MHPCSLCGQPTPSGSSICSGCAALLGRVCATCGADVPEGRPVCDLCGTRMADQPAPPRRDQAPRNPGAFTPPGLAEQASAAAEILGERREVTVLCANLIATARDLEGEDVLIWIDEAMRLLAAAIDTYEGAIDTFTGDGLSALFGVPITHENDPERAVRAALAIQTALLPLRERVRQQHGFDIQARIGINTGLVAAGAGGDLQMEYTVIGDTVSLAARLQTAAPPGGTLVSQSTYQRTRQLFDFQAVPALVLKGMPHAIQAFRPLGVAEAPNQGRGIPGLRGPMVGRAADLERLRAALGMVQQRQQSHIALIAGEAGLGKSRLVAEFRATLDRSGLRVYAVSCLAYTRSTPLWVVAALARDLLGISERDPIATRRAALLAQLKRLGIASDEVTPYLNAMLGLGQAEPAAEARLRLLDAAMLQRQTHAALRQLVLAEARLAPTILIVDDLHWVDPASRDALEYLIQTTADAPLLLILATRETDRATTWQTLAALAARSPERLTSIQLQALSEAEGLRLVDQLIRQTSGAAHSLKLRIVERAAGNPFYAEEIVRMLIDQDGLARDGEAWQVTPRAAELLHDVPETLKGLILARFDRLPEPLRRTLQKVAVLGRSFPISLLLALDSTPPEAASAHLAELEAQQFLVAESFGAERGYAFRHTLIQEAVYGTLLKRDRQKLHGQVAGAIEQAAFWPPDEQIEVLAYHYAESSTPIRAVPLLIAAAEQAARRYSNETAIQHYRRVLALLSDQRRDDDLLRVQIGLGRALKFVGKFTEALQVLEEALGQIQSAPNRSAARLRLEVELFRELADVRQREGALDEAILHLQSGLARLGASGAQEHTSLWRSLMERMAFARFRQGNLDEAFALAQAATSGVDPKDAADPATLADLHNTLGGVFWLQGKLPEAIAYVERSLDLYKSLGYSWGVANAYTNLGILYYSRGMWSRSAESFERSHVLRREIGYMPGLANNLFNLGILRLALGEHTQARADLESSLAISHSLGDDYGVVRAEIGLARVAVAQSRFDAAATHIEAALALLDAAGEDEAVQVRWLRALAQAERGDLASGLASATEALRMADESGLVEEAAECRRVLGILLGRAGHWREAEALLGESLELCRQRNDLYQQGLALLELGRLYQRMARAGERDPATLRSQALAALREARAAFETLGASHDRRVAQALLDQLAPEHAAPPAPPTLTK